MDDVTAFSSSLDGWDPPATVVDDPIDPAPLHALAAALDRDPPSGGVVPPLWHWVYFVRWDPTRDLGSDGHPLAGPLLPPVPERTRVFGGGRVEFSAQLRCSIPARLRTSVSRRHVKKGRTGTMLVVTERRQVEQAGAVVLVEERDLVYRSGGNPKRALAPVRPDAGVTSDAPWQAPLRTDPVLLFRFSALTGNSHRIHYDRSYATSVEGYPDLVVHGPLLALAMADLAADRVPDRRMAAIRFRLRQPAFAGEPVLVTGHPDHAFANLAIVGADSQARATAEVEFD